jgi:hypothetical protein
LEDTPLDLRRFEMGIDFLANAAEATGTLEVVDACAERDVAHSVARFAPACSTLVTRQE